MLGKLNLLALPLLSISLAFAQSDSGLQRVVRLNKVEVRGRLNSQVVAIGAETTGFAIEADGIRWELEFGRNAKLRHQAEELHEQSVIVTGRLNVKRGVEIPQRWIVTVMSLHAAQDAAAK